MLGASLKNAEIEAGDTLGEEEEQARASSAAKTA